MMATQVDLHTLAKYCRCVEFSNANECSFFVNTILNRIQLHVECIESLPPAVKFPKQILPFIETCRVVWIVKQISECKC